MTEKTNFKRKSITVTDFYLYYKSSIEKDTVYDVDLRTYRNIVTDYFKYIRDWIFDSNMFLLPCRLGTLQIVKHQPKNFDSRSLRYDWKTMRELGKPVFYLNEHSNYFKYRFHWGKSKALVHNIGKYTFIATRTNKRDLAQIIFNKQKDYVEV